MIRWLAFTLCMALPAAAAAAETPRPVVSQIVDLTDALAANYVGTVSARIEADLGFPMIGTIAERPASQGDLVAKGDVLARLDQRIKLPDIFAH